MRTSQVFTQHSEVCLLLGVVGFETQFHHCLFLPLSLTWQKESCVFLILRKFWGLSFILRGGARSWNQLGSFNLDVNVSSGLKIMSICSFTELL